MTSEQRKKASIDLTITYLSSYYTEWRLVKVLSNQKILDQRHNFFREFIDDVKTDDDKEGSATIAQEIKHGIIHDSIAHCIQYIEDLFAFLKASENPNYFVRNIITYNAGKITNRIKEFKCNRKTIADMFHFPIDQDFTNEENKKLFDEGVSPLITLVSDLLEFYKEYWFFYIQYKHGLAVALRPFGNMYNEEQIEKDKRNEQEPWIGVYDNLNLSDASKKGTWDITSGAVMMPGFTENVRGIIGELQKENNYLRFARPPKIEFSFELLIEVAKKARVCLDTFMSNYYRKILSKDDNTWGFQLPQDYKTNMYYVMNYDQ